MLLEQARRHAAVMRQRIERPNSSAPEDESSVIIKWSSYDNC